MSIYVCSDIHGQYNLYKKMLKTINFSDIDHLFVVGDAIDRGPQGIELLIDIMNRKNVTLLLGNHELMMWDYFRLSINDRSTIYRDRKTCWFNPSNGGRQTFDQLDALGVNKQEEILDFIESLNLQYELKENNKTILLSHSDFVLDKGTISWRDAEVDEAFDVVWRSPWRFWEYQDKNKYKSDGRLHIIGHVPTAYCLYEDGMQDIYGYELKALVDKEHNIINVDCGCGRMQTKNEWNLQFGLCCLDLAKYIEGNESAFIYVS